MRLIIYNFKESFRLNQFIFLLLTNFPTNLSLKTNFFFVELGVGESKAKYMEWEWVPNVEYVKGHVWSSCVSV